MVHALVLFVAVAVGHGALVAPAQAPATAQRARVPAQAPTGSMPDLVGMTQADAERHALVRKFGLALVPVPREVAGARPGTIVAQSVRPGSRISLRSQVTIHVAAKPRDPETPSRGRGIDEQFGAAIPEADRGTVVPPVVGLDEKTATAILARSDLKARVRVEQAPSNPGLVFRQRPEPRSRVPKGTVVDIAVARRPEPGGNPRDTPVDVPPVSTRDWVIVPSVLGSLRGDAEASLAAVDLRTEGTETRTEVARPYTVFGQDPQPGRRVSRATTVRLSVALPPLVVVPDVFGRTRPDAEALVRERRLTANFDEDAESTAEPGLVVRQAPDAGTQAEAGAVVRATIAVGVVVPNLLTVSATEARARLAAAGFRIAERSELSGTAPASTVLRQAPDAGTRVSRGSGVALVIAAQPPVQVAVPPAIQPPVAQPPVVPPPAVQPPAFQPPAGTATQTEQVSVAVPGPAAEPASRWPLWLVAVVLAGLVAYRFVRANHVEDKPPSLQPEPDVRSAQPPPPPLQLEPHVGAGRSRLETEPSLIAFELRIRASAGGTHTTALSDGPLVGEERRIYE